MEIGANASTSAFKSYLFNDCGIIYMAQIAIQICPLDLSPAPIFLHQLKEPCKLRAAVYCGIMRYNGILMDQAAMEAKQAEAKERLAKIREEIAFLIGGSVCRWDHCPCVAYFEG